MAPMPDLLLHWLTHYGELALFAFLALGILGLPIPDETLLAFAGYLIAKQKLSLPATMICGFLGAVFGITLSYLMGYTLGHLILEKIGPKIGITDKSIEKVQNWFNRIGKWTIFFGYFIPGVRHVTGYLAGATRLNFFSFALFAYLGALIWSQTFIFLGYYFGNQWHKMLDLVLDYMWYVFFACIGILLFYLIRKIYYSRKKIKN